MIEQVGSPEIDARLDRDVRILFALWGAATAAFLPFFTALLQSRGLTPDRIGVILTAGAAAGVAAAPVWSHQADARLGTTRTLMFSMLAAALFALALIPTGTELWVVAISFALLSAASAPAVALADALALGTLGSGRAGGYGRIRRFASAGWAVAVIGFGALYQAVGLRPVLPIYASGLLIYALFLVRFPRTAPTLDMTREPTRFGAAGAALRGSPHLTSYLTGLLLLAVATSSTDGFVPLRILGRGGGPFLIGLAAGIAAVIEIPIFTVSASLGARFGMRNVWLAGALITVATLLGYAVASTPDAVAAIRAFSGLAYGLKYGALVVLTDRLVRPHLRNTGQALMQVATWGIGPILGPAIGGFVYVHEGPPTLFAGAAVLASGAVALTWWSLRGVGRVEHG